MVHDEKLISESIPSLRFAPAVVLMALGGYIIVDYLFLLIVPAQRFIYASIIVFAVMALLMGLAKFRISTKSYRLTLIWITITVFFLVPVVFQKTFYPGYVIGDMTSVLFPLMLLLLGLRYPEFFSIRQGLPLIAGLTLVGVFLGMFFGDYQNRFEAPTSMLFVLSWSVILFAPRLSLRVLGLLVLGVLLAIAFASGERTSVMLWIIALVLVIFVTIRFSPISLLASGLVLVGLLVFGGQLATVLVQDVIAQSRFRTAANVEEDQSLLERYNEARDVLLMLSEAPAVSHVMGHGHGSAYRPHYSYIERNVTADGQVHNIHFGPLLVYFRYGIPGALIFLLLVAHALKSLVRLRSYHRAGTLSPARFVFVLSLCLYLIDWMLRNILVDPIWSYVLAAYLVLTLDLWRKQEPV